MFVTNKYLTNMFVIGVTLGVRAGGPVAPQREVQPAVPREHQLAGWSTGPDHP